MSVALTLSSRPLLPRSALSLRPLARSPVRGPIFRAARPFCSSAAAPLASSSFLEQRKAELRKFKSELDYEAYPTRFEPALPIQSFVQSYSSLGSGDKLENERVVLSGRIMSKREAGANLLFLDLVGGVNKDRVQLFLHRQTVDAYPPSEGVAPDEKPIPFREIRDLIHRGDIVNVSGYPGKTKVGELSLFVQSVRVLSPCLNDIPRKLKDVNVRYRNRHLDMLVNPNAMRSLLARNEVVGTLRDFLKAREFVEVETPVLWTKHGGANATPFMSSCRGLNDLPLAMRIAPELFLKRLVIGGLDRVFEIGKVFRNEDIDMTHNPEFSTCEFYQAYATYEDLMSLTEELLPRMAQAVNLRLKAIGGAESAGSEASEPVPETSTLIRKMLPGAAQAEAEQNEAALEGEAAEPVVLNWQGPYRRIDVMEELERLAGHALPDPNDPASIPEYLELCQRFGLGAPSVPTLPKAIDKLIGGLIEPQCIQPTFIMNHPVCLSPLAKQHPSRPGLTQRFELFVLGVEVCNSYSELNDPEEQRLRFGNSDLADEEAQLPDEDFCQALEYGLPPTAGWGLGLDRMTMILTDNPQIREVLLFPILKPSEQ